MDYWGAMSFIILAPPFSIFTLLDDLRIPAVNLPVGKGGPERWLLAGWGGCAHPEKEEPAPSTGVVRRVGGWLGKSIMLMRDGGAGGTKRRPAYMSSVAIPCYGHLPAAVGIMLGAPRAECFYQRGKPDEFPCSIAAMCGRPEPRLKYGRRGPQEGLSTAAGATHPLASLVRVPAVWGTGAPFRSSCGGARPPRARQPRPAGRRRSRGRR